MLGRKLKSPCPFCGGKLVAMMHLYRARDFIPHIEAECEICRTHIAWPGRPDSKPEDLVAIAERRAPCSKECAAEVEKTIASWRKSAADAHREPSKGVPA